MFDLISLAHGELQDFLQLHSEALQNALLLLGRTPALKATSALIDDVRSAAALTRRLQQGLERLHELLSVKHMHDYNQPESAVKTEHFYDVKAIDLVNLGLALASISQC